MGYEVEVKYKVTSTAALIERLRALGATEEGSANHADLYLAHPDRDFGKTDEALRLRRVGDENHITYKGPKLGGPTKTREEIELPLEAGSNSFEQWSTLFQRLGFRPVCLVKKKREQFGVKYNDRNLIVTLDDAGEIGFFAEVEAIATDEADLPNAQKAVLELAIVLGLSDVEPRSYLRMNLERLELAKSSMASDS